MGELQFGSAMEHLGEFGRYSQIMFLLSCLASFFGAMPVVQDTFVAYTPKHRCSSSCLLLLGPRKQRMKRLSMI